jgi:hypothetical protein
VDSSENYGSDNSEINNTEDNDISSVISKKLTRNVGNTQRRRFR